MSTLSPLRVGMNVSFLHPGAQRAIAEPPGSPSMPGAVLSAKLLLHTRKLELFQARIAPPSRPAEFDPKNESTIVTSAGVNAVNIAPPEKSA